MTNENKEQRLVSHETSIHYADNIQSALRYLYRETAKHNYSLTAHLIAVAAAALEEEAGAPVKACGQKLQ